MEKSKIICISCPKGCHITVSHQDGDITDIEGFTCKNGQEYARNEFTAPVRVLTSTVRVAGGVLNMLPVKTKDPIPKGMMFDCMKEICSLSVDAPVKIGSTLLNDLCGTGVDLIACNDMEAMPC